MSESSMAEGSAEIAKLNRRMINLRKTLEDLTIWVQRLAIAYGPFNLSHQDGAPLNGLGKDPLYKNDPGLVGVKDSRVTEGVLPGVEDSSSILLGNKKRRMVRQSFNDKGNVWCGNNGSNNRVKANMVNQINRPRTRLRAFSNLGVPLSVIFTRLEAKGLLKPLDPLPISNPLPRWYKPSLYCIFHQQRGHTTDSCPRLRHEVQDLIDGEIIPPPEERSNATHSPMPNPSIPPPVDKYMIQTEPLYFNPSSRETTVSLCAQNGDPSSNTFGANHGIVQKERGAYKKGARMRCLFPIGQHEMGLKIPLGTAVDKSSKGQFGNGEVNASWSARRGFVPLEDGSSSGNYCDYHQVPGRSTEICGTLQNKVQHLIEEGNVDPEELHAYQGKRLKTENEPK